MVTLKDVGELAGVTATTASAALRSKDYVKPETMQRVRDAARKLGYKINLSGRSLRSGRSDTITFLTSGIEGDYSSHLAMCVAEEVHKRGARTCSSNCPGILPTTTICRTRFRMASLPSMRHVRSIS